MHLLFYEISYFALVPIETQVDDQFQIGENIVLEFYEELVVLADVAHVVVGGGVEEESEVEVDVVLVLFEDILHLLQPE